MTSLAVDAATSFIHVPSLRFVLAPLGQGADQIVVTRGGQVGSLQLRAGDHLVLAGPDDPDDGAVLLVLAPVGRGNPMLGRRQGGRLVAEPGGVPVAPVRWSVAGRVTRIERAVERGVGGAGRWWVAVRVQVNEGSAGLPDPGQRVRASLQASTGGCMTTSELDALCLRAAVSPERDGLQVALAAASTLAQADRLLADTPYGSVSLGTSPAVTDVPAAAGRTRVIVGPWLASRAPVGVARTPAGSAGPVAHGTPPGRRNTRVGSTAEPSQLSLFSDSDLVVPHARTA